MSLNENDTLGSLVKELLHKKSLSMRKFSKLTSIDVATISRIVNGKRRANLNHLQVFAQVLDVPIVNLVRAAGYEIEKNVTDDANETIRQMQKVIEKSDIHQEEFTLDLLEQRLSSYQQYSRTDEGEEIIRKEFKEKVKKVAGVGPYIQQLQDIFTKFTLRKGNAKELAVMGGVLIYFILTMDLVPDYLFPIGFIDDAIAVQTATQLLSQK